MKNMRSFLILLLLTGLGICALIIVNLTLPAIHPLCRTNFKVSQEEALLKARQFINPEVLDKNPKSRISFVFSKNFLAPQHQNEAVQLDTTALKTQEAWKISFLPRNHKSLDITMSDQGNIDLNDIKAFGYFVYISPGGRLLALDFERILQTERKKMKDQISPFPADTLGIIDFLPMNAAMSYLARFGVDTSKVSLTSKSTQQDSTEQIYSFKFEEQIDQQVQHYDLKFTQSSILSYRVSSAKPSPAAKEFSFFSYFISLWNGIVYIILALGIIILIIQQSRKEAISFRLAFPVVFFVFFLLIVRSAFITNPFEGWITVVGTAFSIFLQCLGILILYSVSESYSRMVWPEKMAIIDKFYQKEFITPDFGKAALRGILLGILSLSFYSLFLYIYHAKWGGGLEFKNEATYYLFSLSPFLGLAAGFLKDAIFHEFYYRLLGLTLLKKWISKNIWVVLVGSLFGVFFSINIKISNPLISIGSFLIPSILFAYFLIRYEIMTVVIGYFTFLLVSKAIVYVNTTEAAFSHTGWGLFFILGVFLTAGLIALIGTKREKEKTSSFIPDYIRKKQEKERLIRELEIARTIQMQFLPKTTPQISGFEIASSCQPAWEVGGDYYDFFKIDKNKLGIVIGDVSNKGVSAAFFMTLIKGFLKALALQYQQPVDILAETNRLFYENVERGYFISMIFAVLDMERGDFYFSRAGHNPVLYFIGDTDEAKWITPPGVGIGLLPDHKFRETLRGEHILLKPGDMVVLYTDGFPEAMNEDLQEYGEERLQKLLDTCRQQSAQDITVSLEAEIVKWQGNRPSHDDRTLVVIKRTS